jgi:hypothetical protein
MKWEYDHIWIAHNDLGERLDIFRGTIPASAYRAQRNMEDLSQ